MYNMYYATSTFSFGILHVLTADIAIANKRDYVLCTTFVMGPLTSSDKAIDKIIAPGYTFSVRVVKSLSARLFWII